MNLTESICRRAARADAVAFDVFDTLIKRDTATPTELFRMRGEAFYTARIEAERSIERGCRLVAPPLGAGR